jgi:monofunctional biosynthetic peptidoglycan transglycosylase
VVWAGVAFSALLLLPAIEVVAVRFINPPVTPLMLLRLVEARVSGAHPLRKLYEWRDLDRMPHDFVKCVLVAEDQRFFRHHGFDWREIHLARMEAERTGKGPRGASTITMQCARSVFLWQGRSWIRKGIEAYYTFWMELLLPKRRILELYVNAIEMGDGIYGIEAAARTHFGVSAANLSHEQCAMLAAILPNPREWNPREPSASLSVRCARILQQEKQITFPLPEAR